MEHIEGRGAKDFRPSDVFLEHGRTSIIGYDANYLADDEYDQVALGNNDFCAQEDRKEMVIRNVGTFDGETGQMAAAKTANGFQKLPSNKIYNSKGLI